MPSRQPLPGVLPPFAPGDYVRVPDPESRTGGALKTWVRGEPRTGDAAGEWLVPVVGVGDVPVAMVEKV